jgi:FkbM family methyltransferase
MLTNLKHFIAYSMPTFKEHPLWAEDRLSPFLRFAQLQFRFLVTSDTIRLPWINNLVLPLKRGDRGLTGNFYLGLWEFNDMAFAIHLLRKDDIFLDIGANLGSYSLLASGVANAKSIAYEPVPHTYQKLMRSIIDNNLTDSITARQVALTSPGTASDTEEVYFSKDKDCENSFVTADYAGDRISISCSTLDKEAFGLSPTLLKIDVEGFEGDVLQGASEVLANRSVLAVIIEG